LLLRLWSPPRGVHDKPDRPVPRDKTPPGVLKRSGDAFVTWRYMYARGQPERAVRLDFEFHCFDVIAAVLRLYVENGVNQYKEKLRLRTQTHT
jgi:hypothetical protein